MKKKYIVRLTAEEREALTTLVNTGKTAAYKIRHAHILLKADADGPDRWIDRRIADAFGCRRQTVEDIRRRFALDGLDVALGRKKQKAPSREKILGGEEEAHLIALACSDAPEGRSRWTLELLAGKLVELNVVETVSRQTVMRTLKKTGCSLTARKAG